jgi:hypothetical protein
MEKELEESLLEVVNHKVVGELFSIISSVYARNTREFARKVRSDFTNTSAILEDRLSNAINLNIEKFIEKSSLDFTFFPPNTKRISKVDQYICAVIEQPPQTRLINYYSYDVQYRLSFPYIQFHVKYDETIKRLVSCYISCTTKPYSSLNDKLYHVPLPNISRGDICMGDTQFLSGDFITCVNDFISKFWSSEFTNNMCERFFQFGLDNDSGSKNNFCPEVFDFWAKKTKENPLFALSATYEVMKPSLIQKITNIPNLKDSLIERSNQTLSIEIQRLSQIVYQEIISGLQGREWATVKFNDLEESSRARFMQIFFEIFESAFLVIQEELNNTARTEEKNG